MSAQTSIEWTDRTWNPTTGCTKVSPGCKHCYAETVAERFWATQYPPVPNLEGYDSDIRARRFTDVQTHPDRLDEPLRWRKPARVFVNSMSDLFHEDVPEMFVYEVFGVMARAQHHTFQVLTKRPARMRDFCTRLRFIRTDELEHLTEPGCSLSPRADMSPAPLPNVHLGVSCEDQPTFDERVEHLGATPAAVRFVSLEPLLGPIDSGNAFDPPGDGGEYQPIDWVIVGGESGPGARPCDLAWIRSIVEQCKAAVAPCFVKQLGARPYDSFYRSGVADQRLYLKNRKGGDPAEWPRDLRVRAFPGAN